MACFWDWVRRREAIVQAQGEIAGSGDRRVDWGVDGCGVGDLTSEAFELIDDTRVELH